MNMEKTSKFLSLILRHKPEVIGIRLDEHGWADVSELLEGMLKRQYVDMEILREIVRTDSKQRYSFNEDQTKIRANQGHSVPVDVELPVKHPPKILYHGTGEKYRTSIEEKGLLPKSRLYVHLSADPETAKNVGKRHGKPVIYQIYAEEMEKDGAVFYQSVNGVWLVASVPVTYMERIQ